MDTAQWPQEIVVKPLEEIVVTNNTCPKPGVGGAGGGNLERKAIRPQKEQALNCPRCNSTNTKFCYYNNYSLTQPRYFCKTCRRYWTEGGSLRNIPVGGGSRKNKRSSNSSNTSSSSLSKTTRLPDLVQPVHNPKIINHAQDLNLAFPSSAPNTTTTHHHQHQHQHHQDFRNISDLIHQLPSNIDKNHSTSAPATTTTSTNHLSAMELLTGLTSRGFNSFMPMPGVPDPNTSVYTSGLNFPLQVDFKPTLNFSLDGLGSSGGYASLQGVHEETNGSRLLFPFEDLKQVSSTTTATGIIEQNKEQADHHQSTGGYWSGMLGGGSW